MTEDSGESADNGPHKRYLSLTPLRTDLGPVADAVRDADADAFVAVGDRFDDALRYLTRFSGPDRSYSLVVVPGRTVDDNGDFEGGSPDRTVPDRAVLCAPALFAEQAEREFVENARLDGDGPAFHDEVVREIRTDDVDTHAGERAAAVVEELVSEKRGDEDELPGRDGRDDAERVLLVPASIPHDAAVYLERADNALRSTETVSAARARKTSAERDRLRRVQRATAAGMARAESVLAESEFASDGAVLETESGDPLREPLRWNGDRLTTERLRREVNATLAARGVCDAGNTVIGAGSSAADLHYVGNDPVRAGETVLIDLSPRGPDGYYGDMTRTFVVDGDGGWERRAYVAVEAAREAALAEIEPGVPATTVHAEAAAELAAYGFDPNATEGESGFTHGTGHGVGLSLHESPSLSSKTELTPGHVVTVEPGVYDPAVGGVRLEDLVAVTAEGYELLAEYPFGIVPRER